MNLLLRCARDLYFGYCKASKTKDKCEPTTCGFYVTHTECYAEFTKKMTELIDAKKAAKKAAKKEAASGEARS